MPITLTRNWYFDLLHEILKTPIKDLYGAAILLSSLKDCDRVSLLNFTLSCFRERSNISVNEFVRLHALGQFLFTYDDKSKELLLSQFMRGLGEYRHEFVNVLTNVFSELGSSATAQSQIRLIFTFISKNNKWLDLNGLSSRDSADLDILHCAQKMESDSPLFRFFFHIDQRRGLVLPRKVQALYPQYFMLFGMKAHGPSAHNSNQSTTSAAECTPKPTSSASASLVENGTNEATDIDFDPQLYEGMRTVFCEAAVLELEGSEHDKLRLAAGIRAVLDVVRMLQDSGNKLSQCNAVFELDGDVGGAAATVDSANSGCSIEMTLRCATHKPWRALLEKWLSQSECRMFADFPLFALFFKCNRNSGLMAYSRFMKKCVYQFKLSTGVWVQFMEQFETAFAIYHAATAGGGTKCRVDSPTILQDLRANALCGILFQETARGFVLTGGFAKFLDQGQSSTRPPVQAGRGARTIDTGFDGVRPVPGKKQWVAPCGHLGLGDSFSTVAHVAGIGHNASFPPTISAIVACLTSGPDSLDVCCEMLAACLPLIFRQDVAAVGVLVDLLDALSTGNGRISVETRGASQENLAARGLSGATLVQFVTDDVGRLLFRYDGDSECIIYSQMFLFLLDGNGISASMWRSFLEELSLFRLAHQLFELAVAEHQREWETDMPGAGTTAAADSFGVRITQTLNLLASEGCMNMDALCAIKLSSVFGRSTLRLVCNTVRVRRCEELKREVHRLKSLAGDLGERVRPSQTQWTERPSVGKGSDSVKSQTQTQQQQTRTLCGSDLERERQRVAEMERRVQLLEEQLSLMRGRSVTESGRWDVTVPSGDVVTNPDTADLFQSWQAGLVGRGGTAERRSVCYYMLNRGSCSKGDACRFSHYIPPKESPTLRSPHNQGPGQGLTQGYGPTSLTAPTVYPLVNDACLASGTRRYSKQQLLSMELDPYGV